MEKRIFQYLEYKKYLMDWIFAQASGGHGMRGKMAKAMGCQTAFVSQVLKGKSHVSLEQAELLNRFLNHSDDEANFFLTLIQLNRAGSEPLRIRLRAQLAKLLEKQSVLQHRLSTNAALAPEDQGTYFSSWIYGAVHIFTTIPPFQSRESIARGLGLAADQVQSALDFLVSRGLVHQEGVHFRQGQVHIHLGKDASMIRQHHTNWRLQAIRSLERSLEPELHYSSVVTISKQDAERVNALLADAIAAVRSVVDPSKEECIYGFCADFFKINS